MPVLVLPDGSVIDESLDVMRWALLLHDPEGWLAGYDRALIDANDGPFKHHLDRFKYPERYGSDALQHRAAALALLQPLEARLGAHTYLCRPARSFTDAALMPFVRQFAATDPHWFARQSLPRVQRWLAEQLAAPLFEQVMARHAHWQPD